MSDVIEVSYTGDLLAHRRCPRAWAYEKHVGMHPYEQVHAMEGHLVHHAMEWLTSYYQEHDRTAHATRDQLVEQLNRYFKILWGKGIRTAPVGGTPRECPRRRGPAFVASSVSPRRGARRSTRFVTRREGAWLADIAEAITAVERYLEAGTLAGGVVYDACRARLIEIGEAVKRQHGILTWR